jgi:small subunit ribosomal protein S2
VWIVDTKKEHLAVDEARKLGLPVIAILDTNCDPDEVDYKIPGNDDAIRSVTLLTRVIADAVAEGLIARSSGKSGEQAEGVVAGDEPLAEWERELLEGSQNATAATAASAPASTPSAAATETTEASAADTVTPPDSPSVEAAAAEGAADAEINAESAITSNEAAAADQADDQAGIAEATDEASAAE